MKTIEIFIEKEENLVETYNKNLVSSTLIEYILNKIEHVKKNEEISIHLYVTEETRGCSSIIRKGLEEEYQKNIKNHSIINIKQFILLLIGLFMLLISTLIGDMSILNEIVLIGAWVPIWEAVELELLTDTNEKKKRIQLKKVLTGEIIEIENKPN